MKKPENVMLDHCHNGRYRLYDVLKAHCEKKGEDYLNLSGEIISNVDFSDFFSLKHIIFSYCHLRNCIFPDVMEDCIFTEADLTHSCFRNDILRRCDFTEASLYNVNFVNARIVKCNFKKAKMKFANFTNGVIECSDFSNARDSASIFFNADFIGKTPFVPLACPTDGSFTGWKNVGNFLIKLRIPASAKRSSCTSRKCRAEYAKVLGIYDKNKKRLSKTVIVNRAYDQATYYEVGKMVYPDSFDENRWEECSNGIHFFINFEDAVRYPN